MCLPPHPQLFHNSYGERLFYKTLRRYPMKIQLFEAETKQGSTGFRSIAMAPKALVQKETEYPCRVIYRSKTCATDKFSFRSQFDPQRNGIAGPLADQQSNARGLCAWFPGHLVPNRYALSLRGRKHMHGSSVHLPDGIPEASGGC
jgi:hypothetical protein